MADEYRDLYAYEQSWTLVQNESGKYPERVYHMPRKPASG